MAPPVLDEHLCLTQRREDAVLAFIPLTASVFWGSMAYTLIGGTAGGTLLTLLFLPALCAIWFRVRQTAPAPSTGRGSWGGYRMTPQWF